MACVDYVGQQKCILHAGTRCHQQITKSVAVQICSNQITATVNDTSTHCFAMVPNCLVLDDERI